ncbi:NON-SPECIFIC LIPID TRANSFER PROTEIN GPI-ANCHORED 2 [Salix viminalis]|uniref:NON-SPECIFIC LIPID TRANSFER PROTEIN GPI-ANCHORED 2 n=1 Tax=Salix viminalis TaxID=40686 RepID=A0A6N2L5U2_SALVM|nr:NON-SPECIFIC LIPID TRANSFER PROTEIN GPI-ANCHORED 2 [Salix viminalis]
MSKLVIGTILLTLAIFSAMPATTPGAPAPVAAPAPVSGDLAPAAAPGPTAVNECLEPLLNMSDCLEYVTQGSNLTVPDKNCCPELAGLIDSNVVCLCQLLGGGVAEQFGIALDVGRALKLPATCKIDTPSVALCAAVGYPVQAPASGPGSAPPAAATPAGLAASPSAGEKSGASTIAGSASAIFGGLAFSFLLTLFWV